MVGTLGVVAGPIVGDGGIASAEAVSTDGVVIPSPALLTAADGIPSAEAFDTGTLHFTIIGEFGIDPDVDLVRSGEGWTALGAPPTIGGNGAVVLQRAYTLFIGGLDRTSYLRESGARISKRMFTQAVAEFRLLDESNSYRPQTWQEIIYYKDGVRKFGGFITSIEENGTPSACPEIQLRCLDYTAILDRRVVTYDYGTETSLTTIVQHIVTNFLDGEGISIGNLDEVTITGGDIKFSDVTVREAFSQLQDITGIAWRLTMDKILHWEEYPYSYAPSFIIHKTSDNWSNPKTVNDGRQVRTVQGVRTNTLVSGLRDETFTAVSTQNAYRLLYQIAESTTPVVTVDGTLATIVADYQRGWVDHDFWYVPDQPWLYKNTAKDPLTVSVPDERPVGPDGPAGRNGGPGVPAMMTSSRVVRIVLAAILAAIATAAPAQSVRRELYLTLAKRVAVAAADEAKRNKAGGAIAIVDSGGHLVYLERIDGTFPAASAVATEKARTAATFRRPTRDFENAIKNGRNALLGVDVMTPLQGGVRIVVDGEVVGAIGVSGAASAQQDDDIAQAAVRAIGQS